MVLQDNRSPLSKSLLHIPRLDLDASRIVGVSGALLLNLAVLGLLLVPASIPPRAVLPPEQTWFEPAEYVKPPPIVEPFTTVRETPKPTPVVPKTIAQPVTEPTVIDQIVVDHGTLQADPVVDAPTQLTTADIAPPSGPVAGIALRYLRAEAPPYPREQLLAGVEGTVMLKVLVDVDGKPIQVDIQTSSGNRKLDEAARRFVMRNWMFEPAIKDGVAVQATGIVPIAFSLRR